MRKRREAGEPSANGAPFRTVALRVRFLAGPLAMVLSASCAAVKPGVLPPEPMVSSGGTSETAAPEAYSLSGTPLVRPEIPVERREKLLDDLREAEVRLMQEPGDEDRLIWVGRRLAYLGRYREAIDLFTRGLAIHPRSHKLLRHRGHRFITLRRFDLAEEDLARAAALIEGMPDEIEPDGAPNALNIPRSTSHSNVWYHLGLARYLSGDFDGAIEAYRRCLPFAEVNDDMLCATAYWLHLALRGTGRDAEARVVLERITPGMEILENQAYVTLLRVFKGELAPVAVLEGIDPASTEFATLGYGVGCWHLFAGDREGAESLFRKVVYGPAWPAFGYIAAEAALARLSDRAGAS